jgi:magnesium-transporting ATPase (P-type)
MKKVTTALTLGTIALLNATPALAQTGVSISPAQPGTNGGVGSSTPLNSIINNIIVIIFSVAILLVLFFLILGAFNWITSGGDKEKIKSARGTIIHALVGLAILALAFVIITVAGSLLNINFGNLTLPYLGA